MKFQILKSILVFFFALHVKGLASKRAELKVDLLQDLAENNTVFAAGVCVHFFIPDIFYRLGQRRG